MLKIAIPRRFRSHHRDYVPLQLRLAAHPQPRFGRGRCRRFNDTESPCHARLPRMDQRRNRTPYGSIAGHCQKPPIRRIRKAWHRHTRRAGRAYVALATGLPSASNAFRNPALRALKLDILAIERHYRHEAPSRKIGLFPPIFAGWESKMLDRRSLLVAGASSLASIMLPRVPGSENAFLLPFAPTAAYADEEDPFKVLVLSRTMFGVVVVDVANKNTPIAGAQVTLTSRYAAGKQLTATTDDEARPSLRSRRFRKATWTKQRSLTRTTLTAASPLAWRATVMSRFPLRASRAAPP